MCTRFWLWSILCVNAANCEPFRSACCRNSNDKMKLIGQKSLCCVVIGTKRKQSSQCRRRTKSRSDKRSQHFLPLLNRTQLHNLSSITWNSILSILFRLFEMATIDSNILREVQEFTNAKIVALQDSMRERIRMSESQIDQCLTRVHEHAQAIVTLQATATDLQTTVNKLMETYKSFWHWDQKMTAQMQLMQTEHKASLEIVLAQQHTVQRILKTEHSQQVRAVTGKLEELEQRLQTLESLVVSSSRPHYRAGSPQGRALPLPPLRGNDDSEANRSTLRLAEERLYKHEAVEELQKQAERDLEEHVPLHEKRVLELHAVCGVSTGSVRGLRAARTQFASNLQNEDNDLTESEYDNARVTVPMHNVLPPGGVSEAPGPITEEDARSDGSSEVASEEAFSGDESARRVTGPTRPPQPLPSPIVAVPPSPTPVHPPSTTQTARMDAVDSDPNVDLSSEEDEPEKSALSERTELRLQPPPSQLLTSRGDAKAAENTLSERSHTSTKSARQHLSLSQKREGSLLPRAGSNASSKSDRPVFAGTNRQQPPAARRASADSIVITDGTISEDDDLVLPHGDSGHRKPEPKAAPPLTTLQATPSRPLSVPPAAKALAKRRTSAASSGSNLSALDLGGDTDDSSSGKDVVKPVPGIQAPPPTTQKPGRGQGWR
eukprot:TRINITY_DN4690_c0_g1_i1.p1 TRINITY_DN4690_c0_g1~~TRINITY_DN4690_c0_g1_i1.p1  ORF type:complete len:663 (+),score=72.94 TRINITY_DN4690_c0_g1_i1:1547-3535(+)